MGRLKLDATMMRRCIELARQGADAGEFPFGAVVACGDKVIGEAMNRTRRDHDESRHAEILAIAQARLAMRDSKLACCTIYTTAEPCAMCSYCIRATGLRRVVFGVASPVMGGYSRWNILMDDGLSHRLPFLFSPCPEVVCGVLAEEALQAWNEWAPLVPEAISLLGLFVTLQGQAACRHT